MDSQNVIKNRYANEARTYRDDALIINFDASILFDTFIEIINSFYPNQNEKLNILDLGAGNGMLTEIVYKKYKNATYTMFDFSSDMLESSKYIFEEKGLDINPNYQIGNFITDDFPKMKYDLIISSYALHHIRNIDDLKSVYQKIKNSLSDKGLFLCIDNYLGQTEEERQKQIELAVNNWEKSYNSRTKALEWGSVLETEDSPATLKTIISLIDSIGGVIPLLIEKSGIMASIYGMTKLTKNEINELNLDYLINSWLNQNLNISNESDYLIDNYKFSNIDK